MQWYARAANFLYERFAAVVDFVQVRGTKRLLSRSREDDVTDLQIAHRTIVGSSERIQFFCDA